MDQDIPSFPPCCDDDAAMTFLATACDGLEALGFTDAELCHALVTCLGTASSETEAEFRSGLGFRRAAELCKRYAEEMELEQPPKGSA